MTQNPEHYCTCMTPDDLAAEDRDRLSHHKAAILKDTAWDRGASISVRFLGGDPNLQRRVREVAQEWTRIANLSFDFRNGGQTDIRIAFMPGKGSWSYLGKMCRQIPEPQPTMNYGWLTPASSREELRRVVLHEFGHAIGLIHEHQNPKGGIRWNRDAVIADLSGPPNNWNEATIENNIFKKYDPGAVVATNVDRDSIMMYPIPAAWTLDGFSADLNAEISHADKVLVQHVYHP